MLNVSVGQWYIIATEMWILFDSHTPTQTQALEEWIRKEVQKKIKSFMFSLWFVIVFLQYRLPCNLTKKSYTNTRINVFVCACDVNGSEWPKFLARVFESCEQWRHTTVLPAGLDCVLFPSVPFDLRVQ